MQQLPQVWNVGESMAPTAALQPWVVRVQTVPAPSFLCTCGGWSPPRCQQALKLGEHVPCPCSFYRGRPQTRGHLILHSIKCWWKASQVVLVVTNLSANGGDVRGASSIPGLGRSPGGKAWQPSPVFLPGKSLDGGAWRATVHGVTKS